MHQIFLALRYVSTRPLSWVSVLGIWLSVTATIATVSLFSGFLQETYRTIQGTSGDIVLSPRAGYTAAGHVLPAPSFGRIRDVALGVDGVEALSPHLLRPAFVQASSRADAGFFDERNLVLVTGLDPELEVHVTRFADYLRRVKDEDAAVGDPARPFHLDPAHLPDDLRVNADLPVAVLGRGLFEELGVRKGDELVLVTLPEQASSETEAIRPLTTRCVVGGAIQTGHFEHDARSVFVHLDAMRGFAASASDSSEISVRARDGADLHAVCAALDAALDRARLPVIVADWEARNIGFLAPVRNQRTILAVLLLFFVLVACFNVFATLTILVTDKVRDIGLLAALGSTTFGIVRVFTACGLIISAAGALAGAITGTLVARNINLINEGIAVLTGVRIFRGSIYHFDVIPVAVHPGFTAGVVAFTIVFALACALVPALRAARMDPVIALRYE